MSATPITRERIDELLSFMPKLGKPGPEVSPEWRGVREHPDGGEFALPYPIYPREVETFFNLAAQPCWCDPGYAPDQVGSLIRNDAAIASASLSEIRTMLTFCVRGERFCDGHWDAMIQGGRVGAILRRLEQLRGTVP